MSHFQDRNEANADRRIRETDVAKAPRNGRHFACPVCRLNLTGYFGDDASIMEQARRLTGALFHTDAAGGVIFFDGAYCQRADAIDRQRAGLPPTTPLDVTKPIVVRPLAPNTLAREAIVLCDRSGCAHRLTLHQRSCADGWAPSMVDALTSFGWAVNKHGRYCGKTCAQLAASTRAYDAANPAPSAVTEIADQSYQAARQRGLVGREVAPTGKRAR